MAAPELKPALSRASRVRGSRWFVWLKWTGLAVVGMVAFLGIRAIYCFRDRSPGYSLSKTLDGHSNTQGIQPLQVGFGRVKITPDISDPQRPIWIAGFDQHRAATAIHDDLWALACVMDDGRSRLAVVVLDAIGFFHDDVIQVRGKLDPSWKVSYAVVCSTHNHSTPDLMGLWGPDPFHTGVDDVYRTQVIQGAVKAVGEAVQGMQPARLSVHEIPTNPAGLVTDTRKPEVYDPDVRVMHFTHAETGATLGTIVGWADHPETVWSKNTEITADFPGYLREALEKGVRYGDTLLEAGLGGTHLYINGAVGGLMTTSPSVTVKDPYLDLEYKVPSHEKALALGRQLAKRVLSKVGEEKTPGTTDVPISIKAQTVEVSLDNNGFLLAPMLGLLDRGHVRWKVMRTEVALLRIGDAAVACIPGEIYPELVNGGIVKAPGGDFEVDPVEVPVIRDLMPGRVKFIFGLANDEIGYIIPKSEWDRTPPYLFGAKKAPYGEVNSVGPETAPTLHAAFRVLCSKP